MELFENKEKRKSNFLEVLEKSIRVIPIILVFLVAIYFILYFSGRHSAKDGRALQIENELGKTLASRFYVVVKDAGYVKRKVGTEEMYIPALLVQVGNVGSISQDRLLLLATFSLDGRSFCSGTISLFNLFPGDSRYVEVKCIESTGFGAIGTGMPLMDISKPLAYVLWLGSGDLTARMAEGHITFKVINAISETLRGLH